jgi:hypothetical protein
VSKHSVDSGLISPALPSKETEHIRIETQSDLLLLAGPTNGMAEKSGPQFRDLREINL